MEYEFAQNQTRNAAVRVPDLLSLSGEGLYENGKIYAGGREYPFCSGTDNVRYTPVVDYSGEILQAALIEELTYWLWPYNDQPHTYGQYLVLDQIYPLRIRSSCWIKLSVLYRTKSPLYCL